MTDLDLSPVELAEFEADFGTTLAIAPQVQDLLFRDARTGYAFTDEPVTEEEMRDIYDLVKWAPTAMNSQPLRIVLIRTPEARTRLLQHVFEGNKAKTASAPLVAVLAADLDFHDELPKIFPVSPGARSGYADQERRERAAVFNTSLQIGYFLIGVRAAGLVAGPMGGFDADGVAAEFFPDGRHRVLLVVNIGHPADSAFRPRLPRLDFDEVVTTA
jgi:3-hydroxypropanoate dehydrogenase